MTSTATESTITCPHCGFARRETMPTEACQIRYRCVQCGEMLCSKAGDCCVYCSYGSVPCPPIQMEQDRSRTISSSESQRD
ncbi:MAG: GDCCVxC domain-containing (seleno)protein [Thermomicrobiales bacterium]